MFDAALEALKSNIDLRAHAAGHGTQRRAGAVRQRREPHQKSSPIQKSSCLMSIRPLAEKPPCPFGWHSASILHGLFGSYNVYGIELKT
jgi:hypothetical protein